MSKIAGNPVLTTGLVMSSRLLKKAGYLLDRASLKLYQPPPPRSAQETRVIPWFRDQGDKTLRLNYDLDEDSLVFDLGGYGGQWSSDIFSMYCCTIHIFEPVMEFADRIEQRFQKNRRISVHRFGLSDRSQLVEIAVDRNGSSVYKRGQDTREAQLVRAIDFINENHISGINLMKINIEGGEYALLEHLIDSGFVKNTENIQVQFHDFVADAERRMASIQAKLKRTHSPTYEYPFVWENWKIK